MVVEDVPGVRSVALGVWVGVGARDEGPDEAGISHFLEHLLFKGTSTRTARQIDEAIEGVGGEMNAYTSREVTAFYVRLPADHVEIALDLLGDVLTDPALRPRDVEVERGVILEEFAMRDDDPGDMIGVALSEALFPGHPLGRDAIGDRDVLRTVSPETIADFFQRWYGAANFVVSAAGDVDAECITAWASERLDPRRRDARPPRRIAPDPVVEPVRVDHRPDMAQVQIALGTHTFGVDDPDLYALAVCNHVLGGGYASRLFEQVREERGLVYSVQSSAAFHSQGGTLSVYAGTSPERAAETVAVIRHEIDALASGGITERELELARGFVEGDAVLGSEDTGSRMARLAGQLVAFDDVWTLDEQVERYRAVSVDDVSRVARRVLDGPWAIATVGPVDEEEVTTWV